MDATRFDTIARLFARRRHAQGAPGRQALAGGDAGPAAGSLATPGRTVARAQDAEAGPTMLFLQAFKAGSVAPKAGADGRYTLTLEQGLGHTVYFSDRPHREVGATPTPQFLAGLGFPEDNPPNAALVVEGAGGETEIAVLALYAPAYDAATRTATYEAEVLGGWQRSVQEGFVEATTDLAERLPHFGAAHLFIDDCPGGAISCSVGGQWVGDIPSAEFGGYCYAANAGRCLPCDPWYSWQQMAEDHWRNQCNLRFAACNAACSIAGVGFACAAGECPDICTPGMQSPNGPVCGAASSGGLCYCGTHVDGRAVCAAGGSCYPCSSDADCGAGVLCVQAPGCPTGTACLASCI
jgi:hypothetical protein